MGKNEWIRDIALILLGIIIGHLLSPTAQVRAFLQAAFALNVWGVSMGTIILIVVAIIMCILLWSNQRAINKQKSEQRPPTLEAKVDAIINKLSISQEDIHAISEKTKTTAKK